jgi:DNA-directed RNA polymerase specialized sigma24 family protein
MIARSLIEVDTDDAVAEALARHREFIRVVAWKLAEGDADLADDLVHEAGIVLWKMDPTRFDAGDREYLEGVLYKRMQKVRWKERRKAGGPGRISLSSYDPDEELEE